MSATFKDYFSDKSENYKQYRPIYPTELFSYLASLSSHHQKAWDCATGNGQSAILLADYFDEVIATSPLMPVKLRLKMLLLKKGLNIA